MVQATSKRSLRVGSESLTSLVVNDVSINYNLLLPFRCLRSLLLRCFDRHDGRLWKHLLLVNSYVHGLVVLFNTINDCGALFLMVIFILFLSVLLLLLLKKTSHIVL